MDFPTLVELTHKSRNNTLEVERLLSFDPGHTTGYAVYKGTALQTHGQLSTQSIEEATIALKELIYHANPDHIVMEDYRVYRWRQKHHVGSDLLTTRVIGCIETLAALNSPPIPITKQPAAVAKNFVTDKKLKEWDFPMAVTKNRHAMDAIRHGCYFILFHKQGTSAPRKPKVG